MLYDRHFIFDECCFKLVMNYYTVELFKFFTNLALFFVMM